MPDRTRKIGLKTAMLTSKRFSLIPSNLACLFAVLIHGCAVNETPTYPSARVTGLVTIDGTPVREGRIQFIPISQAGQVVATDVREGRYDLKGVPIGKVRVMVTAAEGTGQFEAYYGQKREKLKSLIPSKFHDGLEVDVDSTDETRDISL